MFKILRKLLRLAVTFTIEFLTVTWLVKNRQDLAKRFRKDKGEPDASRPVGDRFVPIAADRGPSPFESKMADSAAPLTPAVETHLQQAASHVRIDDLEGRPAR